jgi:hypothetical protein
VYVHPTRDGRANTYQAVWVLRDQGGTFASSSRATRLALPNPDEERIEILLITRDGVLLERHADEEADVVLWAAPRALIVRLPELPCSTGAVARGSSGTQPEIAVTAAGFVCVTAGLPGAPRRLIVAAANGHPLKSLRIPPNWVAALPARTEGPYALVDFAHDVAEVHALDGGVQWAWLNRGDGRQQTDVACTPSQEPPPGD